MKKIFDYWKKIGVYNYTTLSGAIAFFFIINGGSVVFLTLIFFNIFDINISNGLQSVGPSAISTVLNYIYSESYKISQSYSIFFVLTSLWSASTLFYHIIKTGEILYKTNRVHYGLLRRLFSIFLVIIFLVLLLCSIIILIITEFILSKVKYKFLYIILQSALILFVPLVIIIYFNLFVPPYKIPFKKLFKGILFTIVSWIIISIGLTIYLNVFVNFKQIYGALTFVIVFMIWLYLLAQGLVVGLIINHQNWLIFQKENEILWE